MYFPWSGVLLHTVNGEEYQKLRTNRNQLLITSVEQAKLANASVGVTGLSVGNGIAVSLAYMGIGVFRLAEFDTLETANLNRLRSGIPHLGDPKLDVTLEQLYEINPYAEVQTWPAGLKGDDLSGFLDGGRRLDVVFDEIDDFGMKVRLRMAARDAKVPVIMLTSLGDNILVDVERYDTEPDLPLFHGLLGDLPEEILRNPIGEKEKIKYAMQLVGAQYIPTRALESLLQINRTIVGRPQLYSTIAVDGGLAAYLVRRIILGQSLPSARSYLSFDKLLDLPAPAADNRDEILAKLKELTK
jgi:hypothetical protein